jgi:hypothetical protein
MFKSNSHFYTAILATILVSTACSSDAPGTDAAVAFLEPTIDNIQEHIFDKACTNLACHSAENPTGGLNLSSTDASFVFLVDVPVANSVASQNGWLLVKPGDPELSFLVRKIRTPGLGEGGPMPAAMQLTPFYQDLVSDWIEAGAMR